MKTFTWLLTGIFIACLTVSSFAQHPMELTPGYYVVVGAYSASRENVAKNFTEVLNRRGLKASYGFNTSKNYFFVYVNYLQTLRESLRSMENTRKSDEFAQAWVRVIPGDISAEHKPRLLLPTSTEQKTEDAIVQSRQEHEAERAKREKIAEQKPQATETIAVQPVNPVVKETPKQITAQPVVYASSKSAMIEVTDNPPIKQYPKITLGNTEVFLSLFNSTNNRIVEGEVTIVDSERGRPIKEVRGNEYLILPDPKNKSGKLTLICEAFGYRKVEHEISYQIPLADTVKNYVDLMGTTFVINFDLVRYHKGDLATLFNVYFYNDAAIMLPESKRELTVLLQMLQENPHYNIMLHGHTNGNYHGKVISMGPEKNFFSLDGSRTGIGSAKDLSFNRAEVIKEYLEANGIDPARIEVKAWGGKRPVYDKHSVNAKKNVRVEVEILSE